MHDVRPMLAEDIPGVVELQRACFPAPFPSELLWQPEHIERHLLAFPEGQLVAISHGRVIGSASAAIISEASWFAHADWERTLGGPFFTNYDPDGSTLYGADISVHPDHRGAGVARALYKSRFDLVRSRNLARFGTACRMPGCARWIAMRPGATVNDYALEVAAGRVSDRTLTPLLRVGLRFVCTIDGYMQDQESCDAAALLEWTG